MFQKRHYEAVAIAAQESLRLAEEQQQTLGVWIMAKELARTFKSDNSLFNCDRFLRACEPGANVRARS